MSKNKDYIPRNARHFGAFFNTMLEYVQTHKTAWGHIPAPVITTLTGMNASFIDILDQTSGLVTPAQTLARREAQAEATRAVRAFVNQYLRFAPVSNVDRLEMGVPNRDMIPTTIPPPAIPVEGALSFPAVGLVEVRDIRASGDKRDDRAKHGVRIYYGILGEPSEKNMFRIAAPPATGDDLPHSVFTRRARHRFDFSGENGRRVFFCMRFENSKGQAGPWGKIVTAFVP